MNINKLKQEMKLIDLLNKIANGEDVPELIEYNGENYIFQNKDYKNEDRDLYLFSEETPDITAVLNDEVKIVEILVEQQDIDIQEIEDIKDVFIENSSCGEDVKYLARKYNELVQAVKQLDKKIKEKE